MDKFDQCIYASYFAEYSSRNCICPQQTKDSRFNCNCSQCALFIDKDIDLEKCPFCGGKAKLAQQCLSGDRWKCFCTKCGAQLTAKDAKEAIVRWNARA